jgi:alpha-tubulin suppressor-like RCC1 family protein
VITVDVNDGRSARWLWGSLLRPVKRASVANKILKRVTAVSAGRFGHSCAIECGSLYCWGEDLEGALGNGDANAYGQVGNGRTENEWLPKAVFGIFWLTPGVDVLSLGQRHAYVTAKGASWCWGYDGSGQLGNATSNNSRVPVRVVGLEGATAVALGGDHSCALAGGAVYC